MRTFPMYQSKVLAKVESFQIHKFEGIVILFGVAVLAGAPLTAPLI